MQQIGLKTSDRATLLQRVWGFDALACTGCGGRMKFIAVIKDRVMIERILKHIGDGTPRGSSAMPPTASRVPRDHPAHIAHEAIGAQRATGNCCPGCARPSTPGPTAAPFAGAKPRPPPPRIPPPRLVASSARMIPRGAPRSLVLP